MKFCNSAFIDKLSMLPESLTVCATVDESGDEHIISEMMIRRACEKMDKEQRWPFADHSLKMPECARVTRSATILQFPSRP